jgi:hypothetical protein
MKPRPACGTGLAATPGHQPARINRPAAVMIRECRQLAPKTAENIKPNDWKRATDDQ